MIREHNTAASASGSPLALSVIMPAYQRPELVAPAIRALCEDADRVDGAQYEVLIVDDGSVPPLLESLESCLLHPRVRLIRRTNGGRAAAINTGLEVAAGRTLVILDSDIAPIPGWTRAHLEYHRVRRDPAATLIGELVWPGPVGPIPELLGARANPRLVGLRGAVPWWLWYTDNWSFDASLRDRGIVRFDETYRAWGWEDLALTHRLASAGVTAQMTGDAAGHHLKVFDLAGMLRNFAASVPNLLRLAETMPSEPMIGPWLAPLTMPAAIREVGIQLLRLVESALNARSVSPMGAPHLGGALPLALSDAVFQVGIASARRSDDDATVDADVALAHSGSLAALVIATLREGGLEAEAAQHLRRQFRTLLAGTVDARAAAVVDHAVRAALEA